MRPITPPGVIANYTAKRVPIYQVAAQMKMRIAYLLGLITETEKQEG